MDWNSWSAALKPVTICVEVELPYGRNATVEIGTLTYGEWMLEEVILPDPPVPRTISGANGVKLPNTADVTYRRELAAAQEERAYRRLARSIEKTGVSIPGADMKAKAEALKTQLDAGVANALLVWLTNAAMGGKAAAAAAADTFRDGRAGAAAGAGVAAVPDDAESVRGAA